MRVNTKAARNAHSERYYTDRGDQMARRKVIYEELHPETKHGMRNGQTAKNVESTS